MMACMAGAKRGGGKESPSDRLHFLGVERLTSMLGSKNLFVSVVDGRSGSQLSWGVGTNNCVEKG